MKRALILLACLAGVSIFVVLSGGPPVEPGSNADVTSPKQRTEERSRDDGQFAVAQGRAKQYFQRMLIESGDDVMSRFGGDLAGLGLNGRQLQAMQIDQAYGLAHDAVMRVNDVRLRRRMLLELFNEVEQ